LFADTNSGMMPFHVGEGDMTTVQQSAMYALLPYCEENTAIFRCPGDKGGRENPEPFWRTYGTSYKLEGRAFSEPAQPERTVQEFNPKKNRWETKLKKAKPLSVRNLAQHTIGIDIKKALDGKDLKPEDLVQSYIQLARDLVEPWKGAETKWNLLRGVHTGLSYHPRAMHVAFVAGNVTTFSSKQEWELWRGKTGGSDD